MRIRTATAAAAILAATLAGCSSTDNSSTANDKASSSPSQLTPKQRASIEAAAGIPPEPDAATRSAYIADLSVINPEIVHDKPDTAIDRGRNQCTSIKNGEKHDRLVETTNYRFTSPDHPDGFGTATAAKILDVVHKRLCPTF